MTVNKATILGRLGRDPETRRLASGDPVVNLRLATSDTWKDKATGERMEKTEWHSIVIYNEHYAKVAEQYLKKGHLVYIEGKIQTRKWQDQSGVEKYTTEIVLNRFEGELRLMPNGDRSAPDPDSYGTTRTRDSGETRRPSSNDRQPSGGGGGRNYDLDDDIPF